MSHQLSELDRRILELLQHDARLTYKEIADKTGKAMSSIHDRIRRLEQSGYIIGYTAILDMSLLGRSLISFALIRLKEHNGGKMEAFKVAASRFPEVAECCQLTGSYDFILKTYTSDMGEYNLFLQKLTSLPDVHTVQSHLVLSSGKGTAGS